MSTPDDDPRAELAEIAGSVRALVEWYEATGADAVASDASAQEVLSWLDGRSLSGASPARDTRTHEGSSHGDRGRPPPHDASSARSETPGRTVEQGDRFASPPAQAAKPPPPPAVDPRAPVLSLEEKKTRLSVLATEAKACTACVLHEKRKQAVFSRGDPASEICFVGEGPGADEDAQGEPFVGKAGQLLDKMIAGMGLQRDEVYICNIVKCRPPENREPLPPEVAACSHFLDDQLSIVRPKVIVTLGNVPLRALFNVTGIMRLRGTWKLYKGATPVMPTYHPAYVLRNPTPEVRGAVWNDLKQVLTQIGRPIPTRSRG